MESFKSRVSERVYDQCYEYFRKQANFILAETAKEVQEYLAKLETAQTCIPLGLGVLAMVSAEIAAPAALIGHGIAFLAFAGLRRLGGYGKNIKLSKVEFSLSKYTAGNIEVAHSFGTIRIPLESKIKIPT